MSSAVFINIAPEGRTPSLVNVRHVVRIRPGTESDTGHGRATTFLLSTTEDWEYDRATPILNEASLVETLVPIKEIIRRMTTPSEWIVFP